MLKILNENPWFIRVSISSSATSYKQTSLGENIGSVLEVEDPNQPGYRGFLRLRVEFDATKPLAIGFSLPCSERGRRIVKVRYENLKEFCYRCGRLGHTRGCAGKPNPILAKEGLYYDEEVRALIVPKSSTDLFPRKKQIPVVK